MLARLGNHVGARMAFESFAITHPIAVEAELPYPWGREADGIALLRLVEKVGDDHDVVRRPALVPTVEGDDFALIM